MSFEKSMGDDETTVLELSPLRPGWCEIGSGSTCSTCHWYRRSKHAAIHFHQQSTLILTKKEKRKKGKDNAAI